MNPILSVTAFDPERSLSRASYGAARAGDGVEFLARSAYAPAVLTDRFCITGFVDADRTDPAVEFVDDVAANLAYAVGHLLADARRFGADSL
jgi:hypothetical protein